MVGGAVAHPAATPEPDVKVSLHARRSSSVKQALVVSTLSDGLDGHAGRVIVVIAVPVVNFEVVLWHEVQSVVPHQRSNSLSGTGIRAGVCRVRAVLPQWRRLYKSKGVKITA